MRLDPSALRSSTGSEHQHLKTLQKVALLHKPFRHSLAQPAEAHERRGGANRKEGRTGRRGQPAGRAGGPFQRCGCLRCRPPAPGRAARYAAALSREAMGQQGWSHNKLVVKKTEVLGRGEMVGDAEDGRLLALLLQHLRRRELRQNNNICECNEHNETYPVNHSLDAHVIRYRGLFDAKDS